MRTTSVKRAGQPRDGPTRLGLMRVLLFLAVVSTCDGCPDVCLCATQTVKCQNRDLDSIPQPLPDNTKSLFVTGNNITNIGVESFPTRLELLTDLYLNGNEIKSVDSTVFDNLPNLLRLDLTNNKILHFSARAFPVNNTLQVLNLSSAFHNRSSLDVVLSVLQSGILSQLTSLDLSNNYFVILPGGIFTSLSKMTSLSLRNGSLIAVQNGTLTGPPLQDLDLRDNRLRELPNTTLAEFSLKPGLRVLLAGNPWRCDCFLEDLVEWLKDSELVTDRQNLTCVDPADMKHVPLLQLDASRLECNYSGDMKGVLETSYVFLGLVLALIGVIFLLVLYLNRKGIKRWMYNIRDACRDHMEGYHYRYEINSDPRLANLSINSDV